MRAPLWDRVWAKVIFTANPNECWVWTGAKSKKRRGQMRPVIQLGARGTKVVAVARLICELFQGPPPSEFHEAGHTCPNGERDDCVNPNHLIWQTRVENEQWKQDHREAA